MTPYFPMHCVTLLVDRFRGCTVLCVVCMWQVVALFCVSAAVVLPTREPNALQWCRIWNTSFGDAVRWRVCEFDSVAAAARSITKNQTCCCRCHVWLTIALYIFYCRIWPALLDTLELFWSDQDASAMRNKSIVPTTTGALFVSYMVVRLSGEKSSRPDAVLFYSSDHENLITFSNGARFVFMVVMNMPDGVIVFLCVIACVRVSMHEWTVNSHRTDHMTPYIVRCGQKIHRWTFECINKYMTIIYSW